MGLSVCLSAYYSLEKIQYQVMFSRFPGQNQAIWPQEVSQGRILACRIWCWRSREPIFRSRVENMVNMFSKISTLDLKFASRDRQHRILHAKILPWDTSWGHIAWFWPGKLSKHIFFIPHFSGQNRSIWPQEVSQGRVLACWIRCWRSRETIFRSRVENAETTFSKL